MLWSLGIRGTVHTPPQTTREIQFILDLQSATEPHGGPYTLVSPFVENGARGAVDFRAGSPDDFAGFAGLITNGIADDLRFFWRWRDDGCPFPCSGQGGLIGEFDLAGNSLDSVRLLIRDIQMDPLAGDEKGEFNFTFGVDYDFLGAPIPEPRTAAMLFVGLIFGRCSGPAARRPVPSRRTIT